MSSFVSMGLGASGDGVARELEGGTEARCTSGGETEGSESKFKEDTEETGGWGEVMDMTTFLVWLSQ